MLPLGGPRAGGGGACRFCKARGPVGILVEWDMRGDVCEPGEVAAAAAEGGGGGPLSITGDVGPGPDLAGVDGSGWVVAPCLLEVIAAGAVGGDRSGVDLGPAVVVGAAVCGDRGPRVSPLVGGGSVASSRRIRNSNGGCKEPPARSAFGPVGGCIGGRVSAGSPVVGDVDDPVGGAALLSLGDCFSRGWAAGACAVTEPNAGTCGADGGGEERFAGVAVASLGGSGRGGRDSGRSEVVVVGAVVVVAVVVSRRVSGREDGFRAGSAAGC